MGYPSKRLSDYKGRDNNFNLIRMIAAMLVIATHAFGITGSTRFEPMVRGFGIGQGDVGVDIFFFLSGFLVSKSWSGKTCMEFAWARCTRIYPALAVSTIISTVVVGIFFCNVSLRQFLGSASTVSYLAHDVTVLPGVGARLLLPGAFGLANPPFNLSLWTLPHELGMYILLAIIGLAVGLRPAWVALVAALGAAAAVLGETAHLHVMEIDRARFLYFFFTGSLAFTLRERIVLSGRIALITVAVVALAVIAHAPILFRDAALVIGLPYVVLWCAYVPAGALRLWNALGDYSYGTYIWAFPIQYGLFAEGIATTPARSFFFTTPLVLLCAIASWHLIERPALQLELPRFRAPSMRKGVSNPAE